MDRHSDGRRRLGQWSQNAMAQGCSDIPLVDSAVAAAVPGSGGRVLAAKPRGGGGVFPDSPTQQKKKKIRAKRGKRKSPNFWLTLASIRKLEKVSEMGC